MTKVKVTFASGAVRSGKGQTAAAAIKKLAKYVGSLGAITEVETA